MLRDRFTRMRIFLLSLVFALGWYYLSFRLLWRSVMPLVSLLHVEGTTAFGHLIYGAVLGRYCSTRPARAESDGSLPQAHGMYSRLAPPACRSSTAS